MRKRGYNGYIFFYCMLLCVLSTGIPPTLLTCIHVIRDNTPFLKRILNDLRYKTKQTIQDSCYVRTSTRNKTCIHVLRTPVIMVINSIKNLMGCVLHIFRKILYVVWNIQYTIHVHMVRGYYNLYFTFVVFCTAIMYVRLIIYLSRGWELPGKVIYYFL